MANETKALSRDQLPPRVTREPGTYDADDIGASDYVLEEESPRSSIVPDPRLEWCDELNELNQEWAAGDIDDGERAIEFMRRACAVIGTTLGDDNV